MSAVGQIEKRTQKRVIKLFKDTLGYTYLGDWTDQPDNSNVEPELLRPFLQSSGVKANLIEKAITELQKAANDAGKGLYDRNRAVYGLLRYGVKIKPDVGENTETVWLIDWQKPERNRFALAEEVTVAAIDPKAYTKRPDIVLYVNGIALGILELKRSTVSVAEGIRQNLDNQKKVFIEHFFSTIQLVMAGNDSEGLRYGAIATPEKYYLTWKEGAPAANLLDQHLTQMCGKARFLELIHDFIVYDAGTKKLCRANQYFGVRAAQASLQRREGGIIWHTQGSGKSLTMVWLAKWFRENGADARVLIITDRTELDQQIEAVFKGVNADIYRTTSGTDLIAELNSNQRSLLCSLIHKFGGKEDGEEVGDIPAYIAEVKKALPSGFKARGDIVVFVDECHRTQSGALHEAMKAILPDAIFIGFTGTPLLKADKKKSIEVFGRYIHTYKYDEAVRDGVILDLRYEARDIDQSLTSPAKIDQWFEAKTAGLTALARAQLKQRWGTMQKLLSSKDRLEKIVSDILLDMATRPRLMSGHGNALLVSGSIYQACKSYELFSQQGLAGHCAIVTSYKPSASSIKGEETGEGLTEKLRKYEIYKQMLADWFHQPPEQAINRIEEFEKAVKQKFVAEPGQMKLLIVVDKLLTGFDAPSATYLYIDKEMRDHGLFQAICRVNRLDGDDKDYGYIIDYKDLFKSLEKAVQDYTSGAFDAYDTDDVAGLLEDRLQKGRQDLEEARETIRALCEPVAAPKDMQAHFRFFCQAATDTPDRLQDKERKRLALYKITAALIRTYTNLANDLDAVGYTPAEIAALKAEVSHYESVRTEVKLMSADYIDLKMYEPAMRHLIDQYIRAEDSTVVTNFDDLSLVQLIVERGLDAINALPPDIRNSQEAVAETIENNVRKLIIDEQPINPKYYEKMSELLDTLIQQRKQNALDYAEYLQQIAELANKATNPGADVSYPPTLNTPAKRALYDNLDKDETIALQVHQAVESSRQDDWRYNNFKLKRVRSAVKKVLQDDEPLVDRIMEMVQKQYEY